MLSIGISLTFSYHSPELLQEIEERTIKCMFSSDKQYVLTGTSGGNFHVNINCDYQGNDTMYFNTTTGECDSCDANQG